MARKGSAKGVGGRTKGKSKVEAKATGTKQKGRVTARSRDSKDRESAGSAKAEARGESVSNRREASAGGSARSRKGSAKTGKSARQPTAKEAEAQRLARESNRRNSRVFGGLLLFGVGAFLFGSVASYSPLDPSLNTSTDLGPRNLFGAAGAMVADFGVQMIGYTSALLGLLLALAGATRMLRPGPARPMRWLWGILTLVAAEIWLASWATPANWTFGIGAGGLIGGWLDMAASTPLRMAGVIDPAPIVATVSLVAGLVFLMLYLGMRLAHLALLAPVLNRVSGLIGGGLSRMFERLGRLSRVVGKSRRSGEAVPVFAGGQEFAASEAKVVSERPVPRASSPAVAVAPVSPPEPEAPKIQVKIHRPVETKTLAGARKGTTPAKTKAAARAPVAPVAGGKFALPAIELLSEVPERADLKIDEKSLVENADRLQTVLFEFGVKGKIVEVRPGPIVTLYEFEPAPGVKSSRVISLADDIARSMSANAARVAVVKGRNAIGIELPNPRRETVYLRSILGTGAFDSSKVALPITLGESIGGEAVIADLSKMPHLLIAGTTGSGKSVGVNAMILSLLFKLPPDKCRLIMIDPKMLELSVYEGIPHLLTPVVTDPKKAVLALKWVVVEMESRYEAMSRVGVRNITGFNVKAREVEKSGETFTRPVQTGYDQDTGEAIWENEAIDMRPLPHIVVVIDEMADLMIVAGKDIEALVQRLAQMARAAGIHLITATQRPSVDVITGTIKANFPTRISYLVTTKIDSRTILGEQGAEQLLGLGDLLYQASGGKTQRVHGPFVSDEDVSRIVAYLKAQGKPSYVDDITKEAEQQDVPVADVAMGTSSGDPEEDLFREAAELVRRDKRVSTSYVQRRLKIGYNRAATLIERLEEEGVISAPNAAGKREVLKQGAGTTAPSPISMPEEGFEIDDEDTEDA